MGTPVRYLSVACLFAALVSAGTGYVTHDVTGYIFAVLFAGIAAYLLFAKRLS